MHGKKLIVFIAALVLFGCGNLKGLMQQEAPAVPPVPNLKSLIETDTGVAWAFNPDNPDRPIPFQTERYGVYLDPADAAELYLYIEYIEHLQLKP